jgi:hypothetical protein
MRRIEVENHSRNIDWAIQGGGKSTEARQKFQGGRSVMSQWRNKINKKEMRTYLPSRMALQGLQMQQGAALGARAIR